MRRALTTLLLLGAVAAVAVLVGASDDGGARKTYKIEFDSGFGLVEGGDLKIGGVKAGKTTGFELQRKEPYRVVVTAEVSEPGFDSLRSDARCEVRAQSLIGEYFVDCEAGRSERAIPDGGRVPVAQTASTIPPDLVNTVMRRPYKERFRLILSELGTGLAGRPEDLNEVIRRAHPALRELSQTIAILRGQNTIIRDFIRDADQVSLRVDPVKESVAKWAREAEDVTTVQASRSEELGRYYNRLPRFLAELRPTMAELERTADAQIPTLRKLRGAAPELTSFLRDAEPFARASRNSIDDLGRAASAGRGAIRQSSEEVRELRRVAGFAPRLAKPLRQFLQTIDDRKRSTEKDPLARTTAPPAPDKTAYKEGQGFTGMEALLNYVYYQTLAVNGFDEFGHLLRITAFTGGPCSPYSTNPTDAVRKQCASHLGPNQPGLTTPDPSTNGTAAKERAQAARPVKRAEQEPRKAGEPEAPPVEGQRDISKPQVVLPDSIKQLLDRLNKPLDGQAKSPLPVPGGGSPQGSTDVQVLDYLLSP